MSDIGGVLSSWSNVRLDKLTVKIASSYTVSLNGVKIGASFIGWTITVMLASVHNLFSGTTVSLSQAFIVKYSGVCSIVL